MPTGSNDTQWGTKANAAFAMLDKCASGVVSVDDTSGDVTLTTENNSPDQARNALVVITGTPGTARTITIPDLAKTAAIYNTSDSAITITAGSGVTVSLPSHQYAQVFGDAAGNVYQLFPVGDLSAVTGTLPVANGGTGVTSLSALATAMGLGTAATQNTGTSGATIPLLNGANTWSAGQTFSSAVTFSTTATFTSAPVFSDAAGTRTALGLGNAAVYSIGTSGGTIPLLNGANTWATTQTFTAAPVFSNAAGTRTALGLGTAATSNTTAFDAAGTAASYYSSAIAASLQRASNLSDLGSASAARSNLGLANGATATITVSTSGPSGTPANGDIWMTY
jgi:hypothetical protein